MGTSIEGKDVANKGLAFACNLVRERTEDSITKDRTLSSDHVRDLDDGILGCIRKNSFPTRTFNIKTQYP